MCCIDGSVSKKFKSTQHSNCFLSFTDSEGMEYCSNNRNGKWCFLIHSPKYIHSYLKGPRIRKDGRISPNFGADCTERGASSPEGISDFLPPSISCNNYGSSSTILTITPVTFGILYLLASAGKCSETELFKYGPRLNGIQRVDVLPTAMQDDCCQKENAFRFAIGDHSTMAPCLV